MSTQAGAASATHGEDRGEPAEEREQALRTIKRRRDLATHAVSSALVAVARRVADPRARGPAGAAPQISSGIISIAPQGHSFAQIPQPLQ